MEVITIESTAFKEIMSRLDAIKTALERNGNKPLEDKLLDNDEAAALLKVTKRTLQTYRDNGEISFIQKGSKIYYHMSDINEFLQKNHHKAFKRIR